MSGIAGIISFCESTIDTTKIDVLKNNLKYRAQDGFQQYSNKNCNLIYAKLNTTEQCASDMQPIFDNDINAVIVSNSRIDNRDELIRTLNIPHNLTDCEIILAGYKKWKEKVVDHLIGPFSFVIYDTKHKNIFLAVDHFAQKPLYFSFNNDEFIFSSDPRAISFLDLNLYKVNHKKVIDYLIFQGCVDNESFYEHIKKLNKGQHAHIQQNRIEISQYYALPKIDRPSKADYSKKIKDLMTEVIKAQSRSNNHKISTTCSGGLDSTSIASLLNKKIKDKDIYSFSVHFDSLNEADFKDTDERYYVNKFEEKYNAKHKYISSKDTPLNYLDLQLKNAYFPPKSGNGYMHQEIINEMKEEGIRVLFDGFDGDSVISHGVEYLTELGLKSDLKKLLSEVKSACKLNGRKFSTYHTLKDFWIKPNLPFGIKFLFNNFARLGITEEKKFNNLSDDAKQIIDFQKKFKSYYPEGSYKYEKSLLAHRNALTLPFWEEELEIIDFIASVNGVDIRLPFMDKRVIEFCLTVPGEEKFKKGVTRAYFREGMKGVAPDEVLEKHTKANLGPVIMNEIRENYITMLQTINNSDTNIAATISRSKINQLLSKNFEDLTKLEKVNIYKWYVLEKWLFENNHKLPTVN